MLKRDFSDIVYRALANYFDVQVINSNIRRIAKKIKGINVSQVTTVLAGQSELITITPPAGKVYRILSVYINVPAPSGATSGAHSLYIYRSYFNMYVDGVYAENIPYNTPIYSYGSSVGKFTSPGDSISFLEALKRIYGTNDYPIKIKYANGTDADQTGYRHYKFTVEEFDELP